MIVQRYKEKREYEKDFTVLNGSFLFIMVISLLYHFFLHPFKNENLFGGIFIISYIVFFIFIIMEKMKDEWNYSRYTLELNSLKIFEKFIIELDKNLKEVLFSSIVEQLDKKVNSSDSILLEIQKTFNLHDVTLSDELLDGLKQLQEKNLAICSATNDDLILNYIEAIEFVLYTDRTVSDEKCDDKEYEDINFNYEEGDHTIGSYINYKNNNPLLIDSSIIRRKLLILWYNKITDSIYSKNCKEYPTTRVLLFLEFISCVDAASIQLYSNMIKQFIRDSLKLITETYNNEMHEYKDILDKNSTLDW